MKTHLVESYQSRLAGFQSALLMKQDSATNIFLCNFFKFSKQFCYSTPAKAASDTAQKTKFSIKHFFSKSNHIRRKLRIWSHLLKKSLAQEFIFVQCKRSNVLSREISLWQMQRLFEIEKQNIEMIVRYSLTEKQ